MSIITQTPPPTNLLVFPRTPPWHHRVLPGGGFVSDLIDGDTAEVHLAGEIDVFDRHALRDVFTAVLLERDVQHVDVIADQVAFIDLRTLRVIGDVRTRLRRRGGDLVVTGLHGVHAAAWRYTTSREIDLVPDAGSPLPTCVPA